MPTLTTLPSTLTNSLTNTTRMRPVTPLIIQRLTCNNEIHTLKGTSKLCTYNHGTLYIFDVHILENTYHKLKKKFRYPNLRPY
jgi:hypothetical protein